ncbi:hypothetical protein JD844_003853 [Phrynosoma platyrhinos]|uniref:Uncharacterized protein n=1 Tax=Phrynosoma platyrhinos TaxID=52577 RepID=A0ABQ7TDC4_PHRPL|nr:hypothetical protein JD844_003853 [Phrynosoma platyrhinos]
MPVCGPIYPVGGQLEERTQRVKSVVDKDCSGFYSTQQSPPAIIVQCEDVEQELSRITRGRWGRFWGKAKRFGKKHGVSIALGALRIFG